ncbi:MBL fold metallo-hydrolase [Novispirillum sp. DQ9]|uniref:MBL fold metallo-hydrolase n=1 Tax=Novispirillum sp. DQ9 TaxID=3398612 RepID=UPI003C7CE11C
MKFCIHRGTKEIGGTCVELEHEGKRLVLDLGVPLDAPGAAPHLLPPAPGFRGHDPSLLAVVLSHPHQDHYGLARLLPDGVPLAMGAAAERIIAAAAAFVPDGVPLTAAHHLADRVPLELGPFRITPFLVDHSAFDAYALLIEAGGRKLFYTGDFRGHGRKAALFDRLLATPPADVDVLLLEGSTIGRLAPAEAFPTEADVEADLAALARQTAGPLLVCASAQNIDRMVTLFRAARRSGRALVVDLYAAAILEATGRQTIPQSDWDGVHLFVPEWQRRRIKRAGLFDLLHRHDRNRIYRERLGDVARRAIFLFRPSLAADLEAARCLDGACVVWSQWGGYLKDPAYAPFVEWKDRLGLPLVSLHTSGHASVADLQRLAQAVAARRVVPIHSFETARYGEFFDNVTPCNDGEWWDA